MTTKKAFKEQLFITAAVGLIYFLFLVPMSSLFALLPGTEVRPARLFRRQQEFILECQLQSEFSPAISPPIFLRTEP